jgi:hypothetical protein
VTVTPGRTASGGAGWPAWKPVWAASLLAGEIPGEPAIDADGATDGDALADGDATGLRLAAGDALADGDATGLGATDGDGVGRSPTGSGPTKTIAARTPAATSAPTSRPARIARTDLMRREGTSTDEPEAAHAARC